MRATIIDARNSRQISRISAPMLPAWSSTRAKSRPQKRLHPRGRPRILRLVFGRRTIHRQQPFTGNIDAAMQGILGGERFGRPDHALPRRRVAFGGIAGDELLRVPQDGGPDGQSPLHENVKYDAAGRQRRVARGGRRGAEIRSPAIGRRPHQQRLPSLQARQPREFARHAAVPANLQTAYRQGGAALRVREQVLIAAPVFDGNLLRRLAPRLPAHPQKLGAPAASAAERK